MPFQAQVILDSIGPRRNRLTTMEFTLPKLWLAEFNTHCMFARNSASTRAVPFEKQVELMLEDPFIPFEWPIEKKGMAHNEVETRPYVVANLQDDWKLAMDSALYRATRLARDFKIHKQLAGRLLEPWRFQTVLVTGDQASYANFFHLRRDKAAAPEIHRAADLMYEAYMASKPQELKAGEWHTPLVGIGEDLDYQKWGPASAQAVSAARCARLSYLTHHGVRDVAEDVGLFNRLKVGGHWSPLEHVCQALPWTWKEKTTVGLLEWLGGAETGHGKWWGWHQFRKNFENEYWTEL